METFDFCVRDGEGDGAFGLLPYGDWLIGQLADLLEKGCNFKLFLGEKIEVDGETMSESESESRSTREIESFPSQFRAETFQ